MSYTKESIIPIIIVILFLIATAIYGSKNSTSKYITVCVAGAPNFRNADDKKVEFLMFSEETNGDAKCDEKLGVYKLLIK